MGGNVCHMTWYSGNIGKTIWSGTQEYIDRIQDYIGFWGLGMAAVTLQWSTGKNISCIGKTAKDPS